MSRISKKNMKKNQTCFEKGKRKIWIAGTVIFLILSIILISLISKTVTAQRTENRLKLIASVEIKPGDTLWSIASAYMSEEYGSIHDYIKEIKASNGMASDEIHAGNYIIVPYYADETN